MAQSVSFNMDRTYFCPGETIHFSFEADGVSPQNVSIMGPYADDEHWTLIPSVTPSSYGAPFFSIIGCRITHTGYYYATINGVIYGTIHIHVLNVDVSASASDIIVSPGDVVTLVGSGADYYSWSPAAYLDDTEGDTVHATIPQGVDCIDFIVTGTVSGDNRVENGDFDQTTGNCQNGYGFQSDYDCYSPSYDVLYTGEGGYSIYNDASYVHRDYRNPPNNAGHGNFMIINGDELNQGNTYKVVWSQQIHVRPNVRYAFSADVCSFVDENYARLQFKINNDLIGTIFEAHPYSDGWQTFYALWEGTPSNTATITLVDLQTAHSGNDFGIDNISFHDLMACTAQDTVTVCVECYPTIGSIEAPAAICDGGTLVVSPPSVTPSNPNYTYHWEIAPSSTGPWQMLSSLSDIPSNYNGWYLHYVVTCSSQDFYSNSVPIVVFPDLDVHIVANDSVICEGESVTLHAEFDSLSFHIVSPGDILCTDGSIVKPNKWPVSGKTANGIVFYVDNSGSHGWAVSLTQSGPLKWSTNTSTLVVSTNNNNAWRVAIRDLNGKANTLSIRAAGTSSTYPAAYNPDFANDWYLPSIGQLNVLFGELAAVNVGLSAAGGTQIRDNGGVTEANGNVLLWSSTEKSATSAYALEVRDGQIGGINKASTTNKQYVRAIIDF